MTMEHQTAPPVSAWQESVDASIKFTTSRLFGNPRRYLVWTSAAGRTFAPREYTANSAREAEAAARSELAKVEAIIGQRI